MKPTGGFWFILAIGILLAFGVCGIVSATTLSAVSADIVTHHDIFKGGS